VRSAFAKPAGARGLLPDAAAFQRERLVAGPRGLPADTQLDQDGVGVAEAGDRVTRPGDPARVAQVREDARRELADHCQPVCRRVDQRQLGHGQAEPGDAVDQLRCVGRTSADHCDLHVNPLLQ
jgi:hypothetical protein